jgi:hypothetical protein
LFDFQSLFLFLFLLNHSIKATIVEKNQLGILIVIGEHMKKSPIIKIIWFIVFNAMLAIIACSPGIHAIKPSDILGGGPAIETTLLVKRECILSISGRQYVLPVGEYRPIQADSHGIFYAAPNGVVEKKGTSERMRQGGIHFPNTAGKYYSFLSMWVSLWEGDISKLRLPNECCKPYGSTVSLTRNGKELNQ